MGNRRFPADHPLRFLEAQLPYGGDCWSTFDLHQLTDDDVWCLGFDELTDAALLALADDMQEVHLTAEQYRCLSRHELSLEQGEALGLWTPNPWRPGVWMQTTRGAQMPCVALRLSDEADELSNSN
jgi:hypothetical protein